MNLAHVHLMFNHFPLLGFFFSIILLAIGLYKTNESFVRAALLILVISGLFSIPTFFTGEPAEKILKTMPGFTKTFVHDHEEAAELAIWFIGITAVLAAVGLWFSLKKKALAKKVFIAVLALNFITLVLIARTNYMGGLISHPEVRENK